MVYGEVSKTSDDDGMVDFSQEELILIAEFKERKQAIDALLFREVRRGSFDRVRILLDAGADPNALDDETQNPSLGWAAWKGDERITRLLLERGAHLNGLNGFGNTPLDRAEANHQTGIAKFLLSRGGKRATEMHPA